MRLATGRGGRSLWSALQQPTRRVGRSAAAKLRRWRAMADQVTPFRFFATVLGPDGGRRAFRARLGGEADDVLDTFLSQALAYEALEPPSLQGFARFIRANESDIKRETEEAATGVRVMTVHGAKGLEADVVFLVDTGGLIVVPGQRDMLVDDRRRSATIRRSSGGARARRRRRLQRDADAIADAETRARISAPALCRHDARARRALRRRHQGRADAAGDAGTRWCEKALVPDGCGARCRDRRARRALSLAAAAARRRRAADGSRPTPRSRCAALRRPGSLRAGAVAACRAASRCARRRRSPSPTRGPMPARIAAVAAARDGAALRAAAPCIACCSVLPGLPPESAQRRRRAHARARRSGRSRPRRERLAARRRRCSPIRRLPTSSAGSRAEVAIVGRVATARRRLCRQRPHRPARARCRRLAHPRLQDRPRRAGIAGGGRSRLRAPARALPAAPDGDRAGRGCRAPPSSGRPGRNSCQSRPKAWNTRWPGSALRAIAVP